MTLKKIENSLPTPINKPIDDHLRNLPQPKDDLNGIEPDFSNHKSRLEELKEFAAKPKNNKLSPQENEEDLYNLDLQIKDLASVNLPSDTHQSAWTRCSCHCQTERGYTCGGCDTQQNAYTCYRC